MDRFEERKRRGEAGFTLLEMLIVVAILGLLAVFVTMIVAKTIQRQRVTAAAQEIRGDIQAVYTRVLNTQQPVYVRIDRANSHIDIMSDMVATTIYQQYAIPTDISLSTTSTLLTDAPECNWPVVNGFPMLECDSFGRTYVSNDNGVTWAQANGNQTLSVTHVDMVLGTLHPKIQYVITIYPLWNSTAIQAHY